MKDAQEIVSRLGRVVEAARLAVNAELMGERPSDFNSEAALFGVVDSLGTALRAAREEAAEHDGEVRALERREPARPRVDSNVLEKWNLEKLLATLEAAEREVEAYTGVCMDDDAVERAVEKMLSGDKRAHRLLGHLTIATAYHEVAEDLVSLLTGEVAS